MKKQRTSRRGFVRLSLVIVSLFFMNSLIVACQQDISPDIQEEAAVRKVSFVEKEVIKAM